MLQLSSWCKQGTILVSNIGVVPRHRQWGLSVSQSATSFPTWPYPSKSPGHSYENHMPMWTKARKGRQLAPMSTPRSLQKNTVLPPIPSHGHIAGQCTHCSPAPPWKAYTEKTPIRALGSDTTKELAPGPMAQTPAILFPSQWEMMKSTGSPHFSLDQYLMRTYYVLDPVAGTRNAQLVLSESLCSEAQSLGRDREKSGFHTPC